MYGAGINLQQCHVMMFVGITFKARDVIQAVHRIWRFGQVHECDVHIVYTEAERPIRQDIEAKWSRFDLQTERLSALIREAGLTAVSMASTLVRSMGVERREVRGSRFVLVHNDAVDETRRIQTDTLKLVHTSWPFASQYEYTPSYNDFGHTESNEQFFAQMNYLTSELYRALEPGRCFVLHIKDRVMPGAMTGLGFQVVYPFHADAIRHCQGHGFAFLGMKTIVTDVVRENNQTYRLGWSEQCKDGSRMGAGLPEYLLIFRKPPTDNSDGYADIPVVKSKQEYSRARWQIDAHGFSRSSGNRLLTPDEVATLRWDHVYPRYQEFAKSTIYDYEHHVALGESIDTGSRLPRDFMLLPPPSWHPDVWTDITRMRSLNTNQAAANRVKHLCPLPFDIVDRVIAQFSMPGEVVYDPFSGLGTVPVRAVKLGRVGYGCELNPMYFADSVAYCEAAEREIEIPTLFDTIVEAEAVA